jgi:hypothetical protein
MEFSRGYGKLNGRDFFGRNTYGNGISVCRDMAMSVLNFVYVVHSNKKDPFGIKVSPLSPIKHY